MIFRDSKGVGISRYWSIMFVIVIKYVLILPDTYRFYKYKLYSDLKKKRLLELPT